jgi:hypothetical protein
MQEAEDLKKLEGDQAIVAVEYKQVDEAIVVEKPKVDEAIVEPKKEIQELKKIEDNLKVPELVEKPDQIINSPAFA